MRTHPQLITLVMLTTLSTLTTAACSRNDPAGGGAPGAGGRGGAPATTLGIVALQPAPIEVSSDFISTVRSLHSTTIQPQVDGRVTRVFVKSGDVVRAGSPIVQIDPEKQSATLQNTESQRAARVADVSYWKGQVERLQALLKAGAISQNEFDTAQHNLETAQANLSALDAHGPAGQPLGARGAGPRRPGAAAVLPRDGADRRRHRRHHDPRRGSRDDLDRDHDDRRSRRPRGLHPDTGRSRAGAEGWPASSDPRRRRQGDRHQPGELRRA